MSYRAAPLIANPHFQTIYPSLLRRVTMPAPKRERVTTPDGDFLDLDWYRPTNSDGSRLLILSHGLEGHSRRPYVLGLARAALDQGWHVLAWNFRSCSGESNHKITTYHSGQTRDLAHVVHHGLAKAYARIALAGFSIGGNKTLLYLGRDRDALPPQVEAAVVFSVPVHLQTSSERLAEPRNRLYMRNFLRSFHTKLIEKQKRFPDQIDLEDYASIRNFYDFDSRYTAPMHGFASAQEYWSESSSKYWLHRIDRPVLMLTARDDPFLGDECFPLQEVAQNPCLTLELSQQGGHVGFIRLGRRYYWSEQRAMEFLEQVLPAKAAGVAIHCGG